MKLVEIKKGRVAVCDEQGAVLKAKSLGSCLALCVYDPVHKVGAMGVIPMPDDPENSAKSSDYVSMEPVNGLQTLFREITTRGVKKKDLKVFLVGAARYLEEPPEMDIGGQIYKIVKKILSKNRIKPSGEHVGGPFNRSIELNMDTGEVKVFISGVREVTL